MKFRRTKMKNFRLHSDTDVKYPDGVIGILGDNEAGKSTLIEGAMWAMFGAKVIRGTKPGIRWHGAPARHTASVEHWFDLDDELYRIERNESTAFLYDSREMLAEGTTAVNEYIPGLIGMTHDQWASSLLVGQKDVARIAAMDPIDRQSFVRQVLGVGKLDSSVARCRKRKNALGHERDGLVAGLGPREPLAKDVGEAERRVVAFLADLKKRRERHSAQESTHGIAFRMALSFSALEGKHSECQSLAERLSDTITKAGMRIVNYEQQLVASDEASKRVAEAQTELGRIPALRAERDQLRDSRIAQRSIEALKQEVARVETEGVKVTERLIFATAVIEDYDTAGGEEKWIALGESHEKVKANLQDIGFTKRALQQSTRDAERHAVDMVAKVEDRIAAIKALGADGECPTCTQRLGDHFKDVLKWTQQELDKAAEDQRRLATKCDQLEPTSEQEIECRKAAEGYESELETLGALRTAAQHATEQSTALNESSVELERAGKVAAEGLEAAPSIEFDAERLGEVESETTKLGALDESLSDARVAAGMRDRIERSIVDAKSEKEVAESRANVVEKDIGEIGYDSEAHARADVLVHSASKLLEEALVSMTTATAVHEAAEHRLQDTLLALQDYDVRAETLADVSASHLIHENASARLVDFRAAVAGTIRPELEELMTGFIHVLTDGRHEAVTLTDDFQPILYESGVPVEVISGGCEDVAALAMRLAISQMITERAGHPLSLLILDEPFGSLDENRRGNVMNLIRQLKGTFEQVIVISHIPETRDAVDHVIAFEFDEGMGRSRLVA